MLFPQLAVPAGGCGARARLPADPRARGDTFETTDGVLKQLTRTVAQIDAHFDGRLPHYIAVCLTKFDEPRVLETAERAGLLSLDSLDRFDFPRVSQTGARSLIGKLMEVISASGSGHMVVPLFEKYFHPDRIKYFVTSSVGFHINPDVGRFDRDDPGGYLKSSLSTPGLTRTSAAVTCNRKALTQ